MANEDHLEILKQGVEAWNAWREQNPEIKPDLSEAPLAAAELQSANLKSASLWYAVLRDADLSGADLQSADLAAADLRNTTLRRANLAQSSLVAANLHSSDLDEAHLREASLKDASLTRAACRNADFARTFLIRTDLRGADFWNASLQGSYVMGASLPDARLNGAHLFKTVFAEVDLSVAKGLGYVRHAGPSILDTTTLARSKGQLPRAFLRGCGLSEWEIEAAKLHNPDLSSEEVIDITYEIARLKAESPIQVSPLFISYSRADAQFVEALEKRLDEKHIRYWRDVHDLKAGRVETQIERAIRHNPVVLLVLSHSSAESDWVEWEVSKARELEKQEKRDVLCPVALDDAWKTCSWPGPLRRQIEDYNILDFSGWRSDPAMKRQFDRLIEGLGMFYPSCGE